MKTKKQKKRLALDKVSVSRLNNPSAISGGTYDGDDGTNTVAGDRCKANSKIIR